MSPFRSRRRRREPLRPQKRTMAWINVVGGTAVLVSYAHGIWSHPATRGDVWGGVPETIRPAYVVWMLLAAAGYLAFTHFLFFRVDPDTARVGGRFGFNLFNALYVLILGPSALWMPLTFAMLEDPSVVLWWAIRLTLLAVGAGALGILVALIRLRPREAVGAHRVAVIGSIAFFFHTAVLDAFVWPAFFPSMNA